MDKMVNDDISAKVSAELEQLSAQMQNVSFEAVEENYLTRAAATVQIS